MYWHPAWPSGEPILRGDVGLARDWTVSEPVTITITDFDFNDRDEPLFLTDIDEVFTLDDMVRLVGRAQIRTSHP